jgi:hypothetical protein
MAFNEESTMRKLALFALALVLASSSSALAQDVRYNFDKETNFVAFKTYKWVDLKDANKLSELVEKQLKDTVDLELSKKGLQRSEDDTADLYIGYQAGVSKEKEFTSYNSGWGMGPGWYGGGWYGGGGGMTTGQTSTILIGQLALDMYSSKPRTLVFRSVASKTLDTNAKPEKQQKNLAKAVAKMLKNYPPVAKK